MDKYFYFKHGLPQINACIHTVRKIKWVQLTMLLNSLSFAFVLLLLQFNDKTNSIEFAVLFPK